MKLAKIENDIVTNIIVADSILDGYVAHEDGMCIGEAWPPVPPDAETLAAEVRGRRDELLRACDWTQLSDTALTEERAMAWAAYRQALRDVPQQSGFPASVDWPDKPE